MRDRVIRSSRPNRESPGPDAKFRSDNVTGMTARTDNRPGAEALQRLQSGIESSPRQVRALQLRCAIQLSTTDSRSLPNGHNPQLLTPAHSTHHVVQRVISKEVMVRREAHAKQFAAELDGALSRANTAAADSRRRCESLIERGRTLGIPGRELLSYPDAIRSPVFQDVRLSAENYAKYVEILGWTEEAKKEESQRKGGPGDLYEQYEAHEKMMGPLATAIRISARTITEKQEEGSFFDRWFPLLRDRVNAKEAEIERQRRAEMAAAAAAEQSRKAAMQSDIARFDEILARHGGATGQRPVSSTAPSTNTAIPVPSAAHQPSSSVTPTSTATARQPTGTEIAGKKAEIEYVMRQLNARTSTRETALEGKIQEALLKTRIQPSAAVGIRGITPERLARKEALEEILMEGCRRELGVSANPLCFGHSEIAGLMVQLQSCAARLALCEEKHEALAKAVGR